MPQRRPSSQIEGNVIRSLRIVKSPIVLIVFSIPPEQILCFGGLWNAFEESFFRSRYFVIDCGTLAQLPQQPQILQVMYFSCFHQIDISVHEFKKMTSVCARLQLLVRAYKGRRRWYAISSSYFSYKGKKTVRSFDSILQNQRKSKPFLCKAKMVHFGHRSINTHKS